MVRGGSSVDTMAIDTMASPAPSHGSSGSSSDASPLHAAATSTPAPSSSRKRKARAWPAEKELLEQLECCVCYTPMTGAIYQCVDGHLICNACKPNSEFLTGSLSSSRRGLLLRAPPPGATRLTVVAAYRLCVLVRNTCGTCRQPLGNIRNRALEKLAACLILPCKYSVCGCEESMSGKDREAHEAACPHRPYGCPMSASCAFSGSKSELLEHLRTGHSVRRRSPFTKAVLQSSANFLEGGVASGVLFSADSGEEMLFMWSQTIHVLQACIVTFDVPHSHTYRLAVKARGRETTWSAPVRGIREPGGTIFKANDCFTVPQTLAGWFSDSPPESDELNLTLDVEVKPLVQEVADVDTTEMPPVMSQEAGAGGAPNAVQTRLANIQDGVLSGDLRRWLASRGGWGRIELAVCEIIAASSSEIGISRVDIQSALGHQHTAVVLQNATDRLVEEGWVYPTINQDHFKLTDASEFSDR